MAHSVLQLAVGLLGELQLLNKILRRRLHLIEFLFEFAHLVVCIVVDVHCFDFGLAATLTHLLLLFLAHDLPRFATISSCGGNVRADFV